MHYSSTLTTPFRSFLPPKQYIFDAYMPGFQAGDSFILLEEHQETYTDFEEEAAQYAAFYFRLAPEMVRQRRSYTSLFGLFESWGAITAFLYMVFGLTSRQFNAYYFNKQVCASRQGALTPFFWSFSQPSTHSSLSSFPFLLFYDIGARPRHPEAR